MPVKKQKQKKPPIFTVIRINKDDSVSNVFNTADTRQDAIEKAGKLASEERGAYAKGFAVYEMIGMARRPEVPIDFITTQSLEIERAE